MKDKIFRTIFLAILFLMVFYLLGGGGTASLLQIHGAQANPPKMIYLPAVLNYKDPPAPNVTPLPSTSYYFFMKAASEKERLDKAWKLGCQLGQRDQQLEGKQDSVVILAFGIPKVRTDTNGLKTYGASGMHAGAFYSTEQIRAVVEQFGIGYWWCVGSDFDSHVRIAVGTNNYTKTTDKEVTFWHGRAWAQLVNNINTNIKTNCQRGCDGQVSVVGASDIELAWSSPQVAKDWVNGYDSANEYPLYNFGAAEGCPYFARPTWPCGNYEFKWSSELVFQIANTGPVYPLPEIYHEDGIHAEQWYLLSKYSAEKYGFPYRFIGTLTNYGACQQMGDSLCSIIDNKPEVGWMQLYNLINGSNIMTWTSLRYASDIMWTE